MTRLLFYLCSFFLINQAFAQSAPPKREMRGAWIATFTKIDWPQTATTVTAQKSLLLSILDHHKATGINVIYLQVRSQCDAMYPSNIEPWSADLTGLQGRAPNPLWDPLQFAIEEAHKRGMELHAWLNPYRAVSSAGNLSGFAANHVAKVHPEWLLNNGTTITLNPGIPAVRDYILTVINDILQRYDVDGIHFDDYFYPPAGFNDDASFNADPRGFTVRADWRRDNVNLLIQRVYQSILTTKPWVKFGVSPSGIYRSSTDPSIGSNTSAGASQHYSAVYADSKKWLQQGWVDYIEPQVYWYIGQAGSDYNVLVPWWNDQSFGRHIYIGMAGYKVNDAASGLPWTNASMFPNEMRLNRSKPNIYGQAVYNTSSLRSTTRLGFRDSLRLFFYQHPSLQPTMPWRDNTPPAAPMALSASRYGDDSVVLNWTLPAAATNELDKVKRVVVYRSESFPIDLSNANNILAITPNDTTAFRDNSLVSGTHYYYTVTDLDHFQNESTAAATVFDLLPSITCPGNQQAFVEDICSVELADYRSMATTQNAVSVQQSPAPGTVMAKGSHTVTLTATNAAGQTSSCSFTVDVQDVLRPAITALDPNLEDGGHAEASVDPGTCSYLAGNEFDVTATDNCSTNLSYSYTITHNGITDPAVAATSLAGVHFPKGLNVVFWTVTDESGNEGSFSFRLIVRDTVFPVVSSCAPNMVVGTDPGVCSATVSLTPPVATDNCGLVLISNYRDDEQPFDAPYPKGTTTITWVIADEAGNTVYCTQTVTVEDHEAPHITSCAVNLVLEALPGSCSAFAQPAMPQATDNCGVISMSGSRNDGKALNAAYPKGITTIIWTVKDAANNTSTCTQTIKVEDREAPAITNISVNPSVLWPPNNQLRNVTVNYTVSDNCGPVTVSITVGSDEPVNCPGEIDPTWLSDGFWNHGVDGDYEVVDAHHVKLRAKRCGNGNGRIYTLTIKAVDASGNSTIRTVTVTVPKNQGNGHFGKADELVVVGQPVSVFNVSANPNPSTNEFSIRVSSASEAPLSIRVMDNLGRIVETVKASGAASTIRIGARYLPGLYFVEVVQGAEKKMIKLVKQ
jgi:uncharacterized lipoprotein YddW (UPF0748 family)